MNKKIQLLRSNTIYSPSNNLSAKEVAKAALDSLSNVSDGEVVLVRYQETNDDVRSLVCVYHNAGNESGWTFFESASDFLTTDDLAYIQQNYVRRPHVIYETNGTTGLLGVNSSTIGDNWQLTGYDFSPYKYLRCYFKESDFDKTSNYLTPSVIIELPLDAASLSKSNNSTAISGHSSYPANDVYLAGANVTNPNDQNVELTIIVAVDSTKTKFQVICQNSLYGTTKGDRNTDGRYLYKIEGCYDALNSAVNSDFVETDPIFLASPAHSITSANISTWNSYQNLDKVPYVELVSVSSTQTIDPYKMYNFGTVSTGLTIVFNTANEVQGYTKEYTIRFVAGNGCGITLPSGVLYVNGTTPTYTTGHTYEINVVNNCAVVAEFY